MNRAVRCVLATSLLLSVFVAHSTSAVAASPRDKSAIAKPGGDPAPAPLRPEPEPGAMPAARVVSYSEKDVVSVSTKLRYTTLLVLPKQERILDFTCGDKDFWIVNGNENLAYVKPAKAGAETNLNLITASGNIYSFVLSEVSHQPGGQPDLKLFVELDTESMADPATNAPRFVAATEVDQYRRQVEVAKQETRQVKQSAQAEIDAEVNKFISNVRFPYRFEAGKRPFYVRAMYHDDKFTYIQARPEETPTLYEIKDGKPNLVNFRYSDGIYVIDKILDRGYLAVGKQRLAFQSQE